MYRTPLLVLLAALSTLSLCTFANADDFPRRKAGLWKITMTSSDRATQMPGISQCVDAATDEKMAKMGQGMVGENCAKNEMRKEGSSFVGNSVCNFGGSTITSHSLFTGDFTSTYQGQVDATFSPPFMGKSASHMTISGSYEGDCQPDQKPGDIVLPNGKTINIADMERFKNSAAATRNAPH